MAGEELCLADFGMLQGAFVLVFGSHKTAVAGHESASRTILVFDMFSWLDRDPDLVQTPWPGIVESWVGHVCHVQSCPKYIKVSLHRDPHGPSML